MTFTNQKLTMSTPTYFNRIFTALVFLGTFVAHSQDDKELSPEVINVVRPYTPSVMEANKMKEDASLPDSVTTEKKQIQYTINSVPVASTFTPAKGKATELDVSKPDKIYDNYFRLGFGNYTTVLGELYSNFQLSRTDNLGVLLKHHSSQGGIPDVELDDAFYNSSLNLNYRSVQRDLSYGAHLGVIHQMYNWYGLPPSLLNTSPSFDVQHSFFGINAGGDLEMENSIFSGGDVELRYFGDSYSSSEIQAVLRPKFLFDLGGQDVGLNLEVNYLSGSFEETPINSFSFPNYGYLNLGAHPYVRFGENDFSVELGAALFFGMDTEASESKMFIYPKVKASYRLDESAILYGGVDGNLQQNSYFNFSQENPFISPGVMIAPTDRAYEGFVGIKGAFASQFSFDLKASYMQENARGLFVMNPMAGPVGITLAEYEMGNSFGVLYDDLQTLEIFGELQFAASKAVNMGVNVSYFSYTADVFDHAWNLPELTASVFADADFTEKLYGGLRLFYVGERKDLNSEEALNPSVVTLDGFVDLNVELGYRINNRLSVFLKGNNLIGDNYLRWQNYPVQGIQVLGGATYKFDW
jgi:hypothetical protein